MMGSCFVTVESQVRVSVRTVSNSETSSKRARGGNEDTCNFDDVIERCINRAQSLQSWKFRYVSEIPDHSRFPPPGAPRVVLRCRHVEVPQIWKLRNICERDIAIEQRQCGDLRYGVRKERERI